MLGVLTSLGVVLLLVALAGGVRGAARTPDARAGTHALTAVSVPALIALTAFAMVDGALTAALVAGAAAVTVGVAAITSRRTGGPRVREVVPPGPAVGVEVERRAA